MCMRLGMTTRLSQSLLGDFTKKCLPKTAKWLQARSAKVPASILPMLDAKLLCIDELDAVVASFPMFKDETQAFHDMKHDWPMCEIYSKKFLERLDDIILEKLRYAVKVSAVSKEEWEALPLNPDFYYPR